MLSLVWKIVRAILVVVVLVIAIPVLGITYGLLTTEDIDASSFDGIANRPDDTLRKKASKGIAGYARPEESTFLTYPEWAIVYAARDYAAHVATKPESRFPYWAMIGRFWQDYALMIRATEAYPFNLTNHQMLAVIGTSHTIEHGIQSLYENTVGRLTEWTADEKTAADRKIAEVAADYATFLDQTPWYRYPYAARREELMALPAGAEDDSLRTFERRQAFGFAWGVKQAYADLIASGLEATADPAALDIHVWASGNVVGALSPEDGVTIERDLGDAGIVFVTQRYQAFTDMIPRLIARGLRFVEIGGNGIILVTLLAPGEVAVPEGARLLFDYALPVDPGTRRLGVVAAVSRLHTVLPALAASGARLEHVYDF